MKKYEKEILIHQLSEEEKELKHLKGIYNKAMQDINENLATLLGRDDASMQHVIYQIDYQKALKNQIGGILDNLNTQQFKSISDYMAKCYENGFTSALYSMHKQGVPIIMPIDQKKVVKALKSDSKISEGLYKKLGVDTALLKKRITNNLSRGISSNMTYNDIARNIASDGKVGYNNAARIARTEGGRIDNAAKFDAMLEAKAKGADVLKSWNSTLDGKTRDDHRRLDGEIKEIEEPFSNGLMYPCDPAGSAADVINCRCACMQESRWDLDEAELDRQKERAAYWGLDKTENFEDFKKKYLKAADFVEHMGLAAKIMGDGIPEHEEPKKVKNIDYKDKEAVRDAVIEYEAGAVSESIETAYVITSKGEVFMCYGTKDRVFPDFDLKEKVYGATISHNHPIEETEHSFSKDDLHLFMQYNLDILRGCDELYTYEFTRNSKEIDEAPDDWMNFENFAHAEMIELAKANGIGYRRWKNENDRSK